MKLTDFSLLKESHDSYTIGHPKGKSIQVSKSGMSSKAQELISKLRREQHFDEGGEVQDEPLYGTEKYVPFGVDPKDMPKEEAVDPTTVAVNADPENLPTEVPQALLDPNALPASGSQDMSAPPVSSSQAELGQTPEPSPPVAAAQQPNMYDQAIKDIRAGSAAEAKAGQEIGNIEADAAKDREDFINNMTLKRALSDKKAADFETAMANGKIDPDRKWNSMSTGSKIASVFGMLLSGIGSGITGRPNGAFEVLNKAIENDIEAQKNDQSKTMNLWKMNREALGNDQAADLASLSQSYSIAKMKALQAQAAAQGPEAKARMAPLILGLEEKRKQADTRSALMSELSSGGGASAGTEQKHRRQLNVIQQLNPTAYKDMQSKYIPGVGTAQVPVSEAQRKEIISYDSIGKRLQEAMEFQKTKAGALGTFSGSELDAKAKNLSNSLAVELNKLYGLNRLTEVEYHNFMDQIGNIGSFRTGKVVAKLEDLQGQLKEKKDSVYTGLGITPFNQAPDDAKAKAWAKANPDNPLSAQIMDAAMKVARKE